MEHHSVFPTYAPRATADPARLAHICTRYELGVPSDVHDLGGTYNLNLRITTERGDFVARIHRPWVTEQRLVQLHSIRQRLVLRGIPVPLPLSTKRGATIDEHDGRRIEVEQLVSHDSTADSWKHYALALRMLGHFHTALAVEVEPTTFIPPQVENYGTPIELYRWTEKAEASIRAEPASTTTTEALEVCRQTRNILLPMIDWWNQTSLQLPQQVCHGDYGGDNILFAHNSVVAILDFDFLSIHERIYDIAYCLYWAFCRLIRANDPEQWHWERIPRLLEHYESAAGAPITETERRALAMTMARVPLYWIGEAGFMPHVTQNVLSLTQYVHNAWWLFDHRAYIEEQVCGS